MTNKIETLRNRIAQLQIDLANAEGALQEALCENAGVFEGDIIMARLTPKSQDWLEMRVTSVKFRFKTEVPFISGALRRKDGRWSKTKRHVYEWKKAENAGRFKVSTKVVDQGGSAGCPSAGSEGRDGAYIPSWGNGAGEMGAAETGST